MKKIAFVLVLISPWATADYLTRENGEVCSIPEGYNAAPFHPKYNIFGIGENCSFPLVKLLEDQKGEQCDKHVLQYPICETGLTISPGIARPCYKLMK
jgi:hypothetical protein